MNKILHFAAVFCLLCVFCTSVQAKINMFPQPRYLPALNFYGDSGRAYKLQDFKADMLMAMVWSKKCGPCIGDLKYLNNFAKQVAGSGIQVILISPEKEWKNAAERREFLKRVGAPNLVSYLDRKANFADGMGIQVTPTVILVNRNGEEAGQITGSVKWDDPEVIDYMLQLKNKMTLY